jgi:hypothetical protein
MKLDILLTKSLEILDRVDRKLQTLYEQNRAKKHYKYIAFYQHLQNLLILFNQYCIDFQIQLKVYWSQFSI